jgi:FkbM family methyltransferase
MIRYVLPGAKVSDGRGEVDRDRIGIWDSTPVGRARRLLIEALARAGLLWRVSFTVHGRIGTQPIAVPLILGEGIQLIRGDERWMFNLLRTLLPRTPGAFVDVGVNVGQTLVKVKAIDASRPYVGFEPNPVACAYVRELVRANQFANVRLVPVALSTEAGVVSLFTTTDTDPSGSIVAAFRASDRYSSAQFVSVHAGGDVLRALAIGPIGVIKIDVEGSELDVLRGLDQEIRAYRPVIVCEVLPVYDLQTAPGRFRRDQQLQLAALLHKWNYTIARVHTDGISDPLSDFGIHCDIALSNYVFVPAEKYATLAATLGVRCA